MEFYPMNNTSVYPGMMTDNANDEHMVYMMQKKTTAASSTSPLSTASTTSSSSGTSSGWSPEPEVSDYASSPPGESVFLMPTAMNGRSGLHSAPGMEDWDLLSEMLIDDAVASTTIAHAPAYAPHQTLYNAKAHQPPPQTSQLFSQFQPSVPLPRTGSTGFMDALLMQDDAMEFVGHTKPMPMGSTNSVRSPPTVDLFPAPEADISSSASETSSPLQSPSSTIAPTNAIRRMQARQSTNAPHRSASMTSTTSSSSQGGSTDDDDASFAIKSEQLSSEELKKLRRRSQIASSVQRHREKKKTLVATLKNDLTTLTEQLERLRSERKVLHANNSRLVEWEEEAMTQRRKRKQTEELNQRMKKALFQQTTYLMGLRSIMTNVPAPREMEIHDWIHSYTVITGRDEATRQKEYMAYFPESKLDMAGQIVLRETDAWATRLSLMDPYYAEVRVLHDGTQQIFDESDVSVKRELRESETYVDPGTGQVVKKYSMMFVFQEREGCTLDAFFQIAMEATKAVGVFWPAGGYLSRKQDIMQVDAQSQLFYTDLHGSMSLVDHRVSSPDMDVGLEARMLCRVKKTDQDGIIAWDYIDKDELYPMDPSARTIRRDSCGAVVVRREAGGLISFRSICVKKFAPMDEKGTADSVTKALTQRRIGLQASEVERSRQKCVRSVYESLSDAFAKAVTVQ